MKKISPKTNYNGQNKTEQFYESFQLAPLKSAGEILDYRFEPFKLILVHGIPGKVNEMSYKPDFLVIFPDRFRIVEVKANKDAMREDGWNKLKMACECFPWFEFVVAYVNPRMRTIEEEVLN